MISLGDRWDPRSAEWKIEPWVEMGATGIDITVDGEIATVRGIPEPSSICLLGLGSLMLLRLRRRWLEGSDGSLPLRALSTAR